MPYAITRSRGSRRSRPAWRRPRLTTGDVPDHEAHGADHGGNVACHNDHGADHGGHGTGHGGHGTDTAITAGAAPALR